MCLEAVGPAVLWSCTEVDAGLALVVTPEAESALAASLQALFLIDHQAVSEVNATVASLATTAVGGGWAGALEAPDPPYPCLPEVVRGRTYSEGR